VGSWLGAAGAGGWGKGWPAPAAAWYYERCYGAGPNTVDGERMGPGECMLAAEPVTVENSCPVAWPKLGVVGASVDSTMSTAEIR
jgi:hypothetical protein